VFLHCSPHKIIGNATAAGLEWFSICKNRGCAKEELSETDPDFMSLLSKRVGITAPEIALIAITRVILGIGMGLLLSRALKKRARGVAGLSLFMIGAISTVPLALHLRDEMK
jgi:hypothetical protein